MNDLWFVGLYKKISALEWAKNNFYIFHFDKHNIVFLVYYASFKNSFSCILLLNHEQYYHSLDQNLAMQILKWLVWQIY